MRNSDYFRNKKITVVGLARSGLACANLLYSLGADVSVTDKQDNAATCANALKLESAQIKFELGVHTQAFIKGKDLVVVSPGVSNESLPLKWAQEFKVPVIAEIELSWIACSTPNIIAVTGTNGKTTVTTLIGRVLEAAGKRVFTCGNIGNPFCGEVEKIAVGDFVALEVSSFQLEKIETFRPKIALLLNFSRNHLDRYKDMQDYLRAKKRIFMNQDKSDYLVLNKNDQTLKSLDKESKAKIVYFSESPDINPNQAAVLAVGEILGISKEIIYRVFAEFKGVQHRLEFVAEIGGVRFFNDSKATTVDSAVWALQNMSSPVVLIAGGRGKGNDYNTILNLAVQKVKEAVVIGEAALQIRDAFLKFFPVEKAGTLPEAVNIAYKKAVPGDCVLFSPMCKSFDMFSDYEERGRVFKQAVQELIKNGA